MPRQSGVPEADQPLIEAARFNDAQAEEIGLPGAAASIGIDLTTLVHVAEQRAMRMMLVKLGRLEDLAALTRTPEFKPLRFTPEQQEEIAYLTTLYMDGIALGWRAHDLAGES